MAAWNLSPEQEKFIRDLYQTHTARKMLPVIKKELGIEMSYAQLRLYISNHKIRCGGVEGKQYSTLFTPEQEQYVYENVKGNGPLAMTKMLNERFGTSFTQKQLDSFYSNHSLKSGLTGRFEKGSVPPGKGKRLEEFLSPKGLEASKRTRFKKGHVPANTMPVGHVTFRPADGMYYEKVAEPHKWKQKHVVEWERHNGPVPKGYAIRFADGDRSNWHIENLVCIPKAVLLHMNRYGIHGCDSESEKTAAELAKLDLLIRKKKKTGKKE